MTLLLLLLLLDLLLLLERQRCRRRIAALDMNKSHSWCNRRLLRSPPFTLNRLRRFLSQEEAHHERTGMLVSCSMVWRQARHAW